MGSIELWVSIVALVISLYAATSARRSAVAAARSAAASERSAHAAEDRAALETDRERETRIQALSTALPDAERAAAVLGDLPPRLKGDWEALLRSAAKRNPRTPPQRFEQLWSEHAPAWRRAVEGQEGGR